MHPAQAFRETDAAALSAFVRERGFGLVVGADGSGVAVAHAPVLIEPGKLRFHLSRANRLVGVLAQAGRALVCVTGADAYVSPDWYGMADQVPTWNYLSAEIEGAIRILTDAETTRLLDDLSAEFEARLAPKTPWTRAKMDPARFEALLRGIVGYELAIERLEGVRKLSQNKPDDAAAGVAEALAALDDPGSREIARLMAQAATRKPGLRT